MNKFTRPSFLARVFAVWKRHRVCYCKDLLPNALPPFLEPLLFVLAIGYGLGAFIPDVDGLSYVMFLAPGMMATSSVYSASFETTYGTFIRMEYQKVYANILASPVAFRELYLGELLWCGTKGFFFTAAVLSVLALFDLTKGLPSLLAPFVGFLNAIAFGAIGFCVTSLTRNINNFNLYFSGFITPIFFFSGTLFPLGQLPETLQKAAQAIPLTHSVALMRAATTDRLDATLLWNLLWLLLIPLPFAILGYRNLKRRLIV
jgi:lipooligosaccharide transport system permease protein